MPLNPNSFIKQLIRTLIWWFCTPASPKKASCVGSALENIEGLVWYTMVYLLNHHFHHPWLFNLGDPLQDPLQWETSRKSSDKTAISKMLKHWTSRICTCPWQGQDIPEQWKNWIKLTTFPQLIINPGWIESPMLITHMPHIYQHLP